MMKRILLLLLIFSWQACLPKKEAGAETAHQPAPAAVESTQTKPSAQREETTPTRNPVPEKAAQTLPRDPQVKIGRLDNGLSYYIRENKKPENRVDLRLVVNAGSILEDEDQLGLAHFLEHMAFNGTEHFEKQELIDYLQSIGMRFGADINAYTSFDETVYMLQVPTEDPQFLEKGFLILEDWAHGISLEEEEIDKERGVIHEEWRLGRGAQARIFDKQLPVLFHGSRYAERLAIGKMDIIKNAPREAFSRFYRDWYRPDLMAVLAVGDFKTEDIEALIQKHFAALKNPENPKKREYYPVPDHEETLFSIVSDPEQTRSMIQINYKRPFQEVETLDDYREIVLKSLQQSLLNQRLQEKTKEADPPYIFAFTSSAGFVRTKDVLFQGAMVKENGYEEGLSVLMQEAVRAQKFGYTETELDRAKKDSLRRLERAFNEREKTESTHHTSAYLFHFLRGGPLMSVEQTLELYRQLLPGITLVEVNAKARDLFSDDNRVFLISGPEKEGSVLPTEEGLLAIIENVRQMDLKPYKDEVSDAPLLSKQPTPGKIVAQSTWESIGTTQWTLSNGARVIFKPTDFKNDQVLFSAFSPGGSSLVSDPDYFPAVTADTLVEESGLASFSLIELEKKMAGKVVGVTPYIRELREGLSGSASPQDLETLFQLTYLYFTEPRIDQTAFDSSKTKWIAMIENRESDPQSVFSDEINKTLFNNHPRRRPFNSQTIQEMDLEKSLAIYKDRFADAGDFTFLLVGNLDPDQLKPLVETYLAGLPTLHREESWRDIGAHPAEGRHKVEVKKGLEPKSNVRMHFTGPAEWSSESRYVMDSLVRILEFRFREILREEMGGVYGVRVNGSISRNPIPIYQATISFSCDPENIEALTSSVFKELETIQKNGIADSYVNNVKETQTRSFETNTQTNSFWVGNLDYYLNHDLDPEDILKYPKRIETLTSELIQKAAQAYFNQDNYLLGVLLPEEPKEAALE